jgi:hypothetical protein
MLTYALQAKLTRKLALPQAGAQEPLASLDENADDDADAGMLTYAHVC